MSRRGAGLLLLVVLLAMGGCTRTEDYLEVIQAQQKALEEINGILKKIHTAKDMAAAHDELEDCCTRFEKIARKGRELPKPPPPEVERQVDTQALTRAFREMQAEVERIKQLDGGAEFFQQFQGHGSLFAHSE